tara:strand:+ start:120 stop:923 length:804 start_codon:yes stop_codon:yes gene_type:complete
VDGSEKTEAPLQICNFYSIEKNTELNLCESFISGTGNCHNVISRWVLQAGSMVRKYSFGSLNPCSEDGLVLNHELVEQFEKSEYNSYPFYFAKGALRFSGKIINNLNISLLGELASCNINSITTLSDCLCVENNIIVEHAVENCRSWQLFKGVYDGESKAVFDSCVVVKKDAQKSNSVQKNNNILLSDKASVESNPQLEIFADDVECAHGSTSGQIDNSALFYLRSRGLSREKAESMLLGAFLNDVVEMVVHKEVQKLVSEHIASQF